MFSILFLTLVYKLLHWIGFTTLENVCLALQDTSSEEPASVCKICTSNGGSPSSKRSNALPHTHSPEPPARVSRRYPRTPTNSPPVRHGRRRGHSRSPPSSAPSPPHPRTSSSSSPPKRWPADSPLTDQAKSHNQPLIPLQEKEKGLPVN